MSKDLSATATPFEPIGSGKKPKQRRNRTRAKDDDSKSIEKDKVKRKPRRRPKKTEATTVVPDSETKASVPKVNKPQRKRKPRKKPQTAIESEMKSNSERPSNLLSVDLDDDKSVLGRSQEIEHQLRKNDYECMICFDRIGKKAAVWSCDCCWVLFHLPCISKWVRESSAGINGGIWGCPACRVERNQTEAPTRYFCFCGKTEKPTYDPYLVPHSCGDVCSKERGVDCPHLCTSQCHPGPCTPCVLPGKMRTCACGKTEYRTRCGEVESSKRECGKVCRRLLDCKTHLCLESCHNGDCQGCSRVEPQSCFCGKQSEDRPCGSGVWSDIDESKHFSCDQICGKALGCGNHYCDQPCHSGQCRPCVTLPISDTYSDCACGRKQFPEPRTSCLDSYPECNGLCNKPLDCGLHSCPKTCHNGQCKSCLEPASAPCYCGRQVLSFPCASRKQFRSPELLRCTKPCRQKLSCSKHKCARTCCVGVGLDGNGRPVHQCPRPCLKPLPCGNHNCPSNCHIGRCAGCTVMLRDGISCACGDSRIPGPVPCGTEVPHCSLPCSRARECGHPCMYVCHQDECAACVRLVSVECYSGHTTLKNIPCHIASSKGVSCGQPCGKELICGTHSCTRKCHSGACLDDDLGLSEGQCNSICGEIRESCGHPCEQKCHAPNPCDPSNNCMTKITVSCPCGRLTRIAPCFAKSMVVGEMICDDICKVDSRNRAIAEALNIDSEVKRVPYSRWVVENAAYQYSFVESVEKQLKDFIEDPNPMNWTYHFKPTPPERRQLVHELASFYGVVCESLGSGRARYVRVTRQATSRVPILLLSTVAELFLRDPDLVEARGVSRMFEFDLDDENEYVQEDTSPRLFYVLYRRSEIDPRQVLTEFEGDFRVNNLGEGESIVECRTPAVAKKAFITLKRFGSCELSWEMFTDTDKELIAAKKLAAKAKYANPVEQEKPHSFVAENPFAALEE